MSEPRFVAKKRTKSGMEITIAVGNTRHELIERIKKDSETYKKREREKHHGKEIH